MTELSIVIPTYQRCQSLRQLLIALTQQSLPPDRYEVIVAIDDSPKETGRMLERLDVPYALRWTAGPHAGPGAARNRGAALVGSDVVLFLDDDMMPTPALLAEHLAEHNGGDGRVCLGQVRLLPELALSSWERYLNRRFEVQYDKLAQPGYEPNFWDCLTGNLSLSQALFRQSKGFDASFATTKHEDIEFGYRLAAWGARFVYRPTALSYHRFVKSLDDGLADAVDNGVSALRFAHYHVELVSWLVEARWQHYPLGVRTFMRWALARPGRQDRLTVLARRLLYGTERFPVPLAFRQLIYRLAYHIHFWRGVQDEALPGELALLLPAVGWRG